MKQKLTIVKVGGAVVEDEAQLAQLLKDFSAISGRKVLMFALVGVGAVLDRHVVGTGSALRTAVICFYLSNEGVSLLENASRLGLPVPGKLKNILQQLHG